MDKRFKFKRPFVLIISFCTCLFLSSCTDPDAVSGVTQIDYQFAGDWQGNGVDSEGNEATFAAKAIDLGNHKYQLLILDKLDTQKEPMHVMEGVMKENKFVYTADKGVYVGAG